jgi:hypothetical protein
MNVASTLGPALSALAMFWLLRRWVRWTPAAFVGGLVFGFSPFVFVNLAGGHLMTGVLVLVPLVVGCLNDLLVGRSRRPAATGVALGLLVVAQFFVSTEVLVIMALCAVLAVVVLLVYGAVNHGNDILERWRPAFRGLVTAGATAGVLLAYPLWVTFEGPAHLSGLIWPNLVPGEGGIALSDIWHPQVMTALRNTMQVVGGYEGPALPRGEYLGLGLLIVTGLGLIVWWRDVRLWFFAVLGVVSVVLSLGVETHYWVPWRLLARVPLVRSIVPGRFIIVTTLCAAVLLAVVVDRTHAVVATVISRRGATRSDPAISTRTGVATLVAAVAALVVAAAALAPIGRDVADNVPLTTSPVTLPRWFAEVAPDLPPGQVVLAVPAPFTLIQAAMSWQAVDSLHFAMVGGGGPEGLPVRAGKERAGLVVVSAASFSLHGPPGPTVHNVAALRRALAGWGVTQVVIPDPATLPRYDRGTNTASALGLFTLAVGRPPLYVDDSWVWSGVRSPAPVLSISTPTFAACTTDAVWHRRHGAVPDCVMAAAQATP